MPCCPFSMTSRDRRLARGPNRYLQTFVQKEVFRSGQGRRTSYAVKTAYPRPPPQGYSTSKHIQNPVSPSSRSKPPSPMRVFTTPHAGLVTWQTCPYTLRGVQASHFIFYLRSLSRDRCSQPASPPTYRGGRRVAGWSWGPMLASVTSITSQFCFTGIFRAGGRERERETVGSLMACVI